MAGLFKETTGALCNYLEITIPNISVNWWQDSILSVLTFRQKQLVEQKKISKLSDLDLAALLRVLDQNWFALSANINLTKEDRNYLKEMHSVRNRWAHVSPSGIPNDDIYRDLDTLQRFNQVIDADPGLIDKIKLEKNKFQARQTIAENNELGDIIVEIKAEFKVGQVVYQKSDPSIKGVIVEVIYAKPENEYKVFINGKFRPFYASQLSLYIENEPDFNIISLAVFNAHLTALLIRNPGLSTLYSLNAAKIDFEPYQFRPVLKFIRADRPRLLIADGVGVGKTIEAGLILRELQSRREINSVLIICTKPLVVERKWYLEMRRFDEKFTSLDSKTLRYCIDETDLDGEWPNQHLKSIVPFSLFDETLLRGDKHKRGLLELNPPPRFDLVIVDEAHHIRNTNTYRHQAVKYFCDNAEAVLFLTATPIQMGNNDLFVLLNALRPDLVIDKESFEYMSEPNPFINEAVNCARSNNADWSQEARNALLEASNTAWGDSILKKDPEFQRVYDLIESENLTLENRIDCISTMEQFHTFSGIINRTRRRDIDEFTIRRPETIPIEFTEAQREFHDSLLQIQSEIYSRLHSDTNIRFLLTTIRRQASSCLYGLIPLLHNILTRRFDELLQNEVDESIDSFNADSVLKIQCQIEALIAMAQGLDPHDPKLKALTKIIADKSNLPNNKIMVFSSFRHTLNYIHGHLCSQGVRVGLIHGDVKDDERILLKNKFIKYREEKDAIDVLLFSEVGNEGLDYQFCDCIVNYDLPWNPMKIDQRIGRIDRRGQKSDFVSIFNLVIPDTIDYDIYERCLLRIGVFERALGGNEEILGRISSEIRNIAEDTELTREEQKEKLQQLTDNKIRFIREQESFEEQQLELFGFRFSTEQFDKEIENASNYWLSQTMLENLVNQYLQKTCGDSQEYILGEKKIKTLRLSQDGRNKLLLDLKKIPRSTSAIFREWETWLKGSNPFLNITFDAESAKNHQDSIFITPTHPLVKMASKWFEDSTRVYTSFKINDNNLPVGEFPFVIYQWHFHGIRPDVKLRPICEHEEIALRLSSLIEKSTPVDISDKNSMTPNLFEQIVQKHYDLWVDAKREHVNKTIQQAAFKLESLEKSHNAQLAILHEQLANSDNEKIRKMRQAQINNLVADYERRTIEINNAIEKADLTFVPVAYGIINIIRSE